MRRGRAAERRRALAVLLLVASAHLAACRPPWGRPRATPSSTGIAPGVPGVPTERVHDALPPLLTGIPPAATYAWVPAPTVFAGVESGAGADQRRRHADLARAVEVVLRGRGWGEVPPAQAMFLLAVHEEILAPRYVPEVRERARGSAGAGGVARADTVHRVFQGRVLTLALVRRGDGAAAWWYASGQTEAGALFPRQLLELLLADTRP